MNTRWLVRGAAVMVVLCLSGPSAAAPAPSSAAALIDQYCVRCHNERLQTAGLDLDAADLDHVGPDAGIWERAVRKLRARAMPPAGSPRPDDTAYDGLVAYLETELDRHALTNPDPGRTDTFRRLNRTEYQNAVRDLLGLDVDVTSLLPRDDASYGFDNVGAVNLSPTLLERYLSAARKVSRLAVGSPVPAPGSRVVVLPADLTQEDHFEGLPFGTRGGTAVDHNFPLDGDYEIQVRLSRNRNENVEGLTEPHELELTLDGERLQVFEIVPNRNELAGYYSDEDVDKGLLVRLPVNAGPHVVGAAFLKKSSALIETERQPYDAHFNMDQAPAHAAGRAFGLDCRPLRRNRVGRHAEPPAHLRLPSGRPGRRSRRAPEPSSGRWRAAPTAGRSVTGISPRRWRSTSGRGRGATSRTASNWRCGRC